MSISTQIWPKMVNFNPNLTINCQFQPKFNKFSTKNCSFQLKFDQKCEFQSKNGKFQPKFDDKLSYSTQIWPKMSISIKKIINFNRNLTLTGHVSSFVGPCSTILLTDFDRIGWFSFVRSPWEGSVLWILCGILLRRGSSMSCWHTTRIVMEAPVNRKGKWDTKTSTRR